MKRGCHELRVTLVEQLGARLPFADPRRRRAVERREHGAADVLLGHVYVEADGRLEHVRGHVVAEREQGAERRRGNALLHVRMVTVVVEDHSTGHGDDHAIAHGRPGLRYRTTEGGRGADRIVEGDAGGHVDVGDVVAGLFPFGDAHGPADLEAAR
jgi:hypothetical protein